MSTKALTATSKGTVALLSIEVPEPTEHQIQVRLHTSLISPGTERAFVLGLDNAHANYPFQPGYCAAGVVVKTGGSVTRFRPGDRVACEIAHQAIGNVDEHRALRIPDSVSYEHAAFLSLGVIAIQGIRKAHLELGEQVMVLGLGLIGQLAMQFAALNGATLTIGVDRSEPRLEMARACGASLTLDTSREDWLQQLQDATNGMGADAVMECTGFPDAIASAFQAARRLGRVVLLGSTRGESTVNFYKDVHSKGITVIGAHNVNNPQALSRPGYWTWLEDADCYMKLVALNRMELDRLITDRVSWEHAEELYRMMLTWKSDMMGTIIDWELPRQGR